MGYTFEQREQLWIEAGGNPAFTAIAAAVSMAENGSGDPNTISGTNDVGLWQINLDAHPQYGADWLRDPLNNARAAVTISNDGTDWNPWVAYTNGRYSNFLPGGQSGTSTLSATTSQCRALVTLPGISVPGGGRLGIPQQVGQSQLCMDAPLGLGAIILGAIVLIVGSIIIVAFTLGSTDAGKAVVQSAGPLGKVASKVTR